MYSWCACVASSGPYDNYANTVHARGTGHGPGYGRCHSRSRDVEEVYSPLYGGGVPVASALLLVGNGNGSTTGCYPFDLFQRQCQRSSCPAGKPLLHTLPCYARDVYSFRGKLTFPLATEWLV
uniref:Uncharacterized protein n=1 Tax=Anopheles albimanus TaxID=7167 RepID=A0A182FZC7_ANOAL